jgi:hydroxyacyl-ACP dehydratase HTD2-like protein with hotdog domain
MSPVETIGPLVHTPDRLQLFLFSAVTWNTHRIHTDPDHAVREGYPDVLVQSHLHACFVMRALRDAVLPAGGRVMRFAWQNRHVAVPGDRLTCEGRKVREDGPLADYDLVERNAEGTVCVTATATVRYG